MRHFTTTSLPLLAFALCSSLALAVEPTPPLDPPPAPIPADPIDATPTDAAATMDVKASFETLDTNRDGQIAKAEVPVENELTTLFAHFDHNKDLYLSRTEFDEYANEDEEEAE